MVILVNLRKQIYNIISTTSTEKAFSKFAMEDAVNLFISFPIYIPYTRTYTKTYTQEHTFTCIAI